MEGVGDRGITTQCDQTSGALARVGDRARPTTPWQKQHPPTVTLQDQGPGLQRPRQDGANPYSHHLRHARRPNRCLVNAVVRQAPAPPHPIHDGFLLGRQPRSNECPRIPAPAHPQRPPPPPSRHKKSQCQAVWFDSYRTWARRLKNLTKASSSPYPQSPLSISLEWSTSHIALRFSSNGG